jgi:TRAP-type C4-dicarboxylate transport system substrate-binding protein
MRTHGKCFWSFAFVAAMMFLLGGPSIVGAQKYEFKISVDTVPNHPRNHGLVIFIEELEKKSG